MLTASVYFIAIYSFVSFQTYKLDKFQNRNKLDKNFDDWQFQNKLNAKIKTISIYNLDWRTELNRNQRDNWLKLRGMSRSSWMTFNGIRDKIDSITTVPEPYYSYTLKCAEWEAMTRFIETSF